MVYSCRGASKIRAFGPISTIRPPNMTATRSQIWRMTPRSWLMNSIDTPLSRCSFFQEVENLRLNGNIECRNRFIGNDQLRLEHHGARNSDPLALPAGKLMRISPYDSRIHSDTFEGFGYEVPRLGAISREPMNEERLREGSFDLQTRIERCERVLEDHLNVAPEGAEL